MYKKFTAIILTVLLLVTCIAPVSVSAETVGVEKGDIEAANNIIKNAVGGMSDVFKPEEAAAVTGIFNSFVDVFRTASPIISSINGVVTFLRLTGIIKDSYTNKLINITTQLDGISDKIDEINKKLNDISEQMSEIQASAEFNARTEKAIMLQSAWRDFQSRYMENSMDELMTEFSAMELDGIKSWCENPAQRSSGTINNSELWLIYEPVEGGGYKLQYSTTNGLPSDISSDARYLKLDSTLLPDQISWDVNTYRSSIITAIKEKLSNANNFTAKNFPAFDGTGETKPSDTQIQAVAEDAVDLLLYRVTAKELNKSSAFTLQVVRQFSNYCSHLLASNDGLDAMFKSMFLTHSFEYEVKEDFTNFCNHMAIKTGVYGVFALNVLGMSDYATESNKLSTLENYCTAVNAIGECKNSGLTGNDNYCYLTNTCLNLGQLTLSASAEIRTKTRHSINAYEGYSAGNFSSQVRYGKDGTQVSPSRLIGDSGYLLLSYMLRSQGQDISLEYLTKHLGPAPEADLIGIVVSLNSEDSLPITDKTIQLWPTNVVGSYFGNIKSCYLNNLPGGAEQEYVNYHRRVTGSLVDLESGALTSGSPLAALAIYGESHWYWETDEAAFLKGACDVHYSKYSTDVNKVRTGTDLLSSVYYTTYYEQSSKYNCIVSIPDTKLSAGGSSSNPLTSFSALCENIDKPLSTSYTFIDTIKEKLVDLFFLILQSPFASRFYGVISTFFGLFS